MRSLRSKIPKVFTWTDFFLFVPSDYLFVVLRLFGPVYIRLPPSIFSITVSHTNLSTHAHPRTPQQRPAHQHRFKFGQEHQIGSNFHDQWKQMLFWIKHLPHINISVISRVKLPKTDSELKYPPIIGRSIISILEVFTDCRFLPHVTISDGSRGIEGQRNRRTTESKDNGIEGQRNRRLFVFLQNYQKKIIKKLHFF